MMKWPTAILLVGLLTAAAVLPVRAQNICPEGRTFSGACVKADLAQAMRKQSIVYTQPKFSYSAPPILPSEDRDYYLPRHHHELRSLFGISGGCTGKGC